MLWGSCPATIDNKYRLKIPAKFRRDLPETDNNTYYVTSYDGRCAQIYPIQIWEQIAQKLQAPPRMDRAKLKLLKLTSYYGMLSMMDPQGRILIPQTLREDAKLSGDVIVMAVNDHLEVWNHEIIRQRIKEEGLTDLDWERLAELGI